MDEARLHTCEQSPRGEHHFIADVTCCYPVLCKLWAARFVSRLDPLTSCRAEPVSRSIFITDEKGGFARGCKYPNFSRKGCRTQNLASFKASRSYGRLAESSLHWYLRLGIFELETGILSSSGSSTEVPGILRNSVELRRSELHLPPVADRGHVNRLVGRDRRWLSLLVQSAAADYSYPSAQGLFRGGR